MRRVDARGLACPLPVLKARKALLQMDEGETLEVLADDPRAVEEFMMFCDEQGYPFLGAEALAGGGNAIRIGRS